MAYDRFLIAPIEVGLEKDLKPWLLPDDAFQELNNAYVFRGRVRKRFGTRQSGNATGDVTASLSSRLRLAFTATDGSGNASGLVGLAKIKVGQIFSIGSTIYTVTVLGTPATLLSSDLTTTTATLNTTTGAYNFVGAPAGEVVYYYLSEPVMGLDQYYSGSINNQPAFAFDTRYSYKYTSGSWIKFGPASTWWHGSNSDFFWSCNFDGANQDKEALFVSNFFVTNKSGAKDATNDDPIWYWDGTNWIPFSPTYTKFFPATAGDYVLTAKLIIHFKDRLLLLNTIERDAADANNYHYQMRCRFSHNANPFDAAHTAYIEPNQTGYSGGGWIDAATEEEIISAEFIKDRLIVYFERSTWELAYTGNQILPFVWQKLNTELGSEATFSSVPFDKMVLTMSNTGIHACNGSNVERIDSKIPDDVFSVRNKNDGVKRVAGIRDFDTELVYWTFPSSDAYSTATTYPNRVLVYNYKNASWAYNDDCFTTFGYFEQQDDRIWANALQTWAECDFTWNSGVVQSDSRRIIAGNHQGFVLIIDPGIAKNEQSMYITNVTFPLSDIAQMTIYDHTLQDEEFIKVYNATFNMGGTIVVVPSVIGKVLVDDKDSIFFDISLLPGIDSSAVYMGAGTVARVSNISIISKQWNPYIDKGRGVFLGKAIFAVERTAAGQLTINYSTSGSNLDMISEAQGTGTQIGTNILDTYAYPLNAMEITQNRLWHPVYLQAEGETVQLNMYLSDEQMMDESTAECDFQVEGIILFTQPTSANLF